MPAQAAVPDSTSAATTARRMSSASSSLSASRLTALEEGRRVGHGCASSASTAARNVSGIGCGTRVARAISTCVCDAVVIS